MTRTHTIDLNKRLLITLASLLVATILMYMGFVLSVIADTAVRADAERAGQRLTARIAGLESDYLRLSHTLTREEALALGFTEPRDISQVSARGSISTLTLRAQ